MTYSKLARARPNFYKDRDYGGNSYGGSNHRGRNLTHMRGMGIGNFSSHAKTFDLKNTYNYCENSLYDYYKEYHDSYDYGNQSCGRGVNHEELVDENVFGSGCQREHLFLPSARCKTRL
ncbi:hypothetical protein M9H77_02809 [Catharanthus roseus]|uniref:Uncharacterized protein n=1 Tax=Catharanthus roseus TaxID=4058 RepID=A0ACC0C9Y4_CATRO|nr:hypothetical protein M9H77_02809 [Catharanthus roseus]